MVWRTVDVVKSCYMCPVTGMESLGAKSGMASSRSSNSSEETKVEKDNEDAKELSGATPEAAIMVDGYFADRKWEKIRQEMVEDEKRRWTGHKARRGCCVVQ